MVATESVKIGVSPLLESSVENEESQVLPWTEDLQTGIFQTTLKVKSIIEIQRYTFHKTVLLDLHRLSTAIRFFMAFFAVEIQGEILFSGTHRILAM